MTGIPRLLFAALLALAFAGCGSDRSSSSSRVAAPGSGGGAPSTDGAPARSGDASHRARAAASPGQATAGDHVRKAESGGDGAGTLAVEASRGSAPCTIPDGYQTVIFSDGSAYSGSFSDCRPQPGPARFRQGEVELEGHATPIEGGVLLRTSTHEVRFTLGPALTPGAANATSAQ